MSTLSKIILSLMLSSTIFSLTDIYLDSDEDGYTDLQEIKFGSDPNDDSSLIYKGGWPYNTNKDSLSNPGFKDCANIPYGNGCNCESDAQCLEDSTCGYQFNTRQCAPKVGAKVPRFVGVDQFGEYFDLYDLANQGFPIVIEISSMYLNQSKVLSSWLSSGDESVKKMKWWQNNFEKFKALIDAGDIFYVRFLHKGSKKGIPIAPGDAAKWHQSYPHLNIITIEDPEALMKTWFRPTGLPAVFMLNEDMTIRVSAEGGGRDTQMRRGVKHAFEAVIFDNYIKTHFGDPLDR